MRAVVLARQTARVALRDAVPAAVAVTLALMLLAAPLADGFALGQRAPVTHDLGLTAAWGVGTLIAARLGLGLRLDPLILARPVSVADVVVGRASGTAAALGVLAGAALLCHVAVGALWAVPPPGGLPALGLLLWLEWVVVAAEGALLAALLRPTPAALALAAIWAIGHLADPYFHLAASDRLPAIVAHAVFAVVPDLDLLDVQRPVVDGVPLDRWRVALAAGYAVAWTATLTTATLAVLARREPA